MQYIIGIVLGVVVSAVIVACTWSMTNAHNNNLNLHHDVVLTELKSIKETATDNNNMLKFLVQEYKKNSKIGE